MVESGRNDRYKYSLFGIGKNREELYDMKKDSGEMVNIANKESSVEIMKRMRNRLHEFAEKKNDTVALRLLEGLNY